MAFINGDSGNNELEGTNFDDVINGLGGDDVITGGDGADSLFGGDGDDEFVLGWTDYESGETYSGGSGWDTLKLAQVNYFTELILDTSASVEEIDFQGWLMEGSAGGDTMDLSGVLSFVDFLESHLAAATIHFSDRNLTTM